VFVCFEGIDGAGKSTQAHMLYNTLVADGIQVELVRDPGTTRLGDAIRKLILEFLSEIVFKVLDLNNCGRTFFW
jgi:dTMP kinase